MLIITEREVEIILGEDENGYRRFIKESVNKGAKIVLLLVSNIPLA